MMITLFHPTCVEIQHPDIIESAIELYQHAVKMAPEVKKIPTPTCNSWPGDIYVPFWQADRPAAFDVTMTTYSYENAAFGAGHALEASKAQKYGTGESN